MRININIVFLVQRLYGGNLLPAEHDQSHPELDTYNIDKIHSPVLVSTICKRVTGYVVTQMKLPSCNMARLHLGREILFQESP